MANEYELRKVLSFLSRDCLGLLRKQKPPPIDPEVPNNCATGTASCQGHRRDNASRPRVAQPRTLVRPARPSPSWNGRRARTMSIRHRDWLFIRLSLPLSLSACRSLGAAKASKALAISLLPASLHLPLCFCFCFCFALLCFALPCLPCGLCRGGPGPAASPCALLKSRSSTVEIYDNRRYLAASVARRCPIGCLHVLWSKTR